MRWIGTAFATVVFALAAALPETPKKPVADTYHGVKVIDEYRWLEKLDDPAVKKWAAAQTLVTRTHLDKVKALPALRKRLKELMSAEAPSLSGLQFRGG